MVRHILPIARYTLLEALRNRLLWLALILVAAGLAFTQFLQQVAITESTQIQAALLAALLRVGAVFMLAGFVVTSMVREFNDKVTELILSRPLKRRSYFLGKLAGYTAVALALALIFSLPLTLFAPVVQVALWGLSLACELLLVTAFALFCVLTLTQVMSALAAVAGFYLLARSISALQIMAANPLSEGTSIGQSVVNFVIDAIAFLLPGIDRMTQTGWLIYAGPTTTEVLQVLAQTAAYALLLCGAAMFDLQRKNF
ncbi:MAG: ABC transporter permease [Betaproteobacteria bacterium]|nr:MAG: ABC transporter permease [Betaproteobacteria bacterium]